MNNSNLNTCKTKIPSKDSVNVIRKSSNFQSFMITVKLFFGISYLAMPNVFSHAGWFGGIFLYSSVLVLNGYTMIQLLRISEYFPEVKSYSEMGRKVLGDKYQTIVDIIIWIK